MAKHCIKLGHMPGDIRRQHNTRLGFGDTKTFCKDRVVISKIIGTQIGNDQIKLSLLKREMSGIRLNNLHVRELIGVQLLSVSFYHFVPAVDSVHLTAGSIALYNSD